MAKKPSAATPTTPPTDDETSGRENLAAFFLILMEWHARNSRSASREDGSSDFASGDGEKGAAHADEDE